MTHWRDRGQRSADGPSTYGIPSRRDRSPGQTNIIQEERVRMCLTSAQNHHSHYYMNTYQIPACRNEGLQEVACRAFNKRNGCHHRDSHPECNVYCLHICTYSDFVGKTCFHSVQDCERRVTHARNDNTHQNIYSRPQNQPNNFQPVQSYHHNQMSFQRQKTGNRRSTPRECWRANKQ